MPLNVDNLPKVVESELVQSNEILDLFAGIQIVNSNDVVGEIIPTSFHNLDDLRATEMCFFRVKKLSFDEEYPRREAFENVLLSIDNTAFNFVYVLTGTESGVDLCVGVVKNANDNKRILDKSLKANDYGKILGSAFAGNFTGSELQRLKLGDIQNLLQDSVEFYSNGGVVMGVPSINEKEGNDEYDFQGMDRLINSMLGLNWRLVIVCEPVSEEEILNMREDIYELYNRLSVYAKRNLQHTSNTGDSVSFTKNDSDTRGKNKGVNDSVAYSKGESHGQEDSWNKNKTTTKGTSSGTSESHTSGESTSYSQNRGSSNAVTIEMANKRAQEIMKYIDEELLERFKLGFSKGMFKTSIYYMAEEPAHADRLKNNIISLFQGNKSSYSPLISQKLDLSKESNTYVIKNFQNRCIKDDVTPKDVLMLLSRPFDSQSISLSSYLTTKEISLLAGMPQKEVPGISLREAVGFGLNEKDTEEEKDIHLGWLVHKGRVMKEQDEKKEKNHPEQLKGLKFYIKRDALKKHTFIAGTTGSGKTTTCHRLLLECKDVPFMVIEPAKTEYRTLINTNKLKDVIVFTLGNETVAPFRINPFELIKGEIISAHIDMVKATFTSAFPMEASMPQLLEEAIYLSYEQRGWNIDTNENDFWGDKAFDPDVNSFPILSDLLNNMQTVVKNKNFGANMQGDYIGSLVSRLSNLTVGSKGAMLNCSRSVDFDKLADSNVILELEELKSPEDKALLMGFVLTRMAAVIKAKHNSAMAQGKRYQHLTLVEEAHRLLSKVEYGDSGSKKVAVECFTDLLAEVRKYGEGLIIVDQIPNKLASEVLKNTNTKIIHKILAKDDKEAVGDTMLMDDKQKQYLSALTTGEVVVFTENTDKPVNVQIQASSDTNEATIPDSDIRELFMKYKKEHKAAYKDFELLRKGYRLFKDIHERLENITSQEDIDYAKNNKLKKVLEDISKKDKISIEELWDILIERYERLAGKFIANGENECERLAVLKNFYKNIFYKEKLIIDDVEDFLCNKLGK